MYIMSINASAHLNGRRLAAEPRFLPSVIGQEHVDQGGRHGRGISPSCVHQSAVGSVSIRVEVSPAAVPRPTAEELGRGLGITLVESANLIGALTAKGVLKRRVYHVLAIVPPSYQRRNSRMFEPCTRLFSYLHQFCFLAGDEDEVYFPRDRVPASHGRVRRGIPRDAAVRDRLDFTGDPIPFHFIREGDRAPVFSGDAKYLNYLVTVRVPQGGG